MDILLTSTWRLDGYARIGRGRGGQWLADFDRASATQYTWRQGRYEVIVERDGELWHVSSTSTGKLFGPREVLFEARHKQERRAAWDVMACVIRICKNEDEGVRAGRAAARWMLERRVTVT